MQPGCLGMGILYASTSQYLLLVGLLPLSLYEMAFPCGITDFSLVLSSSFPLSSSPTNAVNLSCPDSWLVEPEEHGELLRILSSRSLQNL